jgi:hypothetical protein
VHSLDDDDDARTGAPSGLCFPRAGYNMVAATCHLEEWAKGQQGPNGMARADVLLAISPIPSLAFISFICNYLCLPILQRIAPPAARQRGTPQKGRRQGF